MWNIKACFMTLSPLCSEWFSYSWELVKSTKCIASSQPQPSCMAKQFFWQWASLFYLSFFQPWFFLALPKAALCMVHFPVTNALGPLSSPKSSPNLNFASIQDNGTLTYPRILLHCCPAAFNLSKPTLISNKSNYLEKVLILQNLTCLSILPEHKPRQVCLY